MLSTRLETLAKIPHLDEEKARTLQQKASQSMASSRGTFAEQLVRQKVRELRAQQTEQGALEKLVEQAFDALPAGTHLRIRTIKGNRSG